MGIIDSDHRLPEQHGQLRESLEQAVSRASRSSYTYLFPALSNAADAGLFPNSDEQQTLEKLKLFEQVFRQNPHPGHRLGLAAAYTYFGQFMNHDMSAPVGDLLTEANSIPTSAIINSGDQPGLDKLVRASSTDVILNVIRNEQSTPLTLESLYAEGPESGHAEVRDLFDSASGKFKVATTTRMTDAALSSVTMNPSKVFHDTGAPDLPRDSNRKLTLIADRRNDENLIISQLHLAFMLLHNKLIDALVPTIADRLARFHEARRLLTLHYQWCVVNDYLKHLLSPGVVEKTLAAPPRLTTPNAVPMEFTTAAFRFGHSMVSATYDFNENFGEGGRVQQSALLQHLFKFTTRGGMGSASGSVAQLPDHWVADWNRLTVANPTQTSGADTIDFKFAPDMLGHMPHGGNLQHASIFFRNIVRGFHRRIPFGQTLARAYGLTPLTAAELRAVVPSHVATPFSQLAFDSFTPAWLYFLCEADQTEQGRRLGPVASHIIADTVIGLLKLNQESVLNSNGGQWHPRKSPLRKSNDQPLTSIADLLLFATAK